MEQPFIYIGSIQSQCEATIEKVEKQLIHNYPSTMNAKEKTQNLIMVHDGDIPISIKSSQ